MKPSTEPSFPSPPEFATSAFAGHVVLITTNVTCWAEAIRRWEERGVKVSVLTDLILLEYWATSQDMRSHVSGLVLDESGLVDMAQSAFDHDWLHWMADIPAAVLMAPGRYMRSVPDRMHNFLSMLQEEGRMAVYQDRRDPLEVLHELRALDMREDTRCISPQDWHEWLTKPDLSP